MKILLVSSSILPQSGGSSIIVENLARNFTKKNMLVLGSAEFNQTNKVVRDSDGPEFRYFFSELSLFGRGARFFDWFRKWKFQPLVNEIKRTIQQEKITYVIGVYPNQFYCLAASRAAKNLNIPFSSYFHNTYIENTAITDPKAVDYQNEIFENSQYVFVMSKGMQVYYKQKYGLNKFVPLVHTFNEYPDVAKNTGIPKSGKETYNLVAIGNFNESNLEATKRFIEAISQNP